jgi:hypothetical protein
LSKQELVEDIFQVLSKDGEPIGDSQISFHRKKVILYSNLRVFKEAAEVVVNHTLSCASPLLLYSTKQLIIS